ncbi:MAG: hypothetical protein JNL67_22725 [Planctomycetaceae bacterium]|nr:hypothetical protein [Planctomycetaceae bacterium]
MDQEYGTSSGTLLRTAFALPCSSLFIAAGVLIFQVVGMNVFSVMFSMIGVGLTYAILKSSWSRTRTTGEGIYKRSLFSRDRTARWSDVQSWSYIPDSETQMERVELLLKNGKPFPIYGFETESVGLECFIADIRRRIGKLESVQESGITRRSTEAAEQRVNQ